MPLFNQTNRYRVRYKDVLWKKRIYHVGEIMPEEFTQREVARHINGRRFEVVDPMELKVLAEKEEGQGAVATTPILPEVVAAPVLEPVEPEPIIEPEPITEPEPVKPVTKTVVTKSVVHTAKK